MHTDFHPADPDYEDRIRAGVERQSMLQTLGVRLGPVSPGRVTLEMGFDEAWTSQPGLLHAGVATTLMNSACVYAAMTLTPADATVLAAEFKVDLLGPAQGVRFRGVGEVVQVGRTLTRCRSWLEAQGGGRTRRVAQMSATMINVGG